MTNDDVRQALQEAVTQAGSVAKWRLELQQRTGQTIAYTYLYRVLKGQQPPGPRILQALGFTRDVTYSKEAP